MTQGPGASQSCPAAISIMPDSTEMQRCRWCGSEAMEEVLDLGQQPHASWFPTPDDLTTPEPRWPLHAMVCGTCWLVQLDSAAAEEPTASQPHPASVSPTMRSSARTAVNDLIERYRLDAESRIVEVASHGGYLQTFFAERDIQTRILPSEALFGGEAPVGEADLLIDDYLLAHQPDPGATLRAYANVMASDGDLVLEFDHALTTIGSRQFDGFRHGHFSYISLTWLARAIEDLGLQVVDAEELPAYGGAVRAFVRRALGSSDPSPAVPEILARERQLGLETSDAYRAFRKDVLVHRWELRDHLRQRRAVGSPVVGYGAPSRATTLLNFAGITADLLPFTADASVDKWGRLIPGARIPIVQPDQLIASRPAEVLILLWDLQSEVIAQLSVSPTWHPRFLVPMPRLQVVTGA